MTELITVGDLLTRINGYISMSPFGYSVSITTLKEIVAVLEDQQITIYNLRSKLAIVEDELATLINNNDKFLSLDHKSDAEN